jgi:hypothetical protein
MFMETLVTIVELWDQCRCPSTNGWIKKMWHIYPILYYSAINKNEIVSFARKWMELKITMLCIINQTEKDKHHMRELICGM